MDRIYVVSSIQFRPEETDRPPTRVNDLGFSLVRLMRLSGRKATGVRANLQVTDPDALDELARHYTSNTRLEWTFEIGGGGRSFSVVLRWTKFDRLTGSLQLVRTAVLRDLIGDAEQDPDEHAGHEHRREPAAPRTREADEQSAEQQTPPAREPTTQPGSGTYTVRQQVANLWERLVGHPARLSAEDRTTS